MSIADDLRRICDAARPMINEWLALTEEFAALRDAAKEKGLDWSQIKQLLKAQAQDERDGGSKHVDRIIEKAEFASSYAAMLGLGETNMNENKSFDQPSGASHVGTTASNEAADAQPEDGIEGGSRPDPDEAPATADPVGDEGWQCEDIPPGLDRRGELVRT